jgi:hypothetical protein
MSAQLLQQARVLALSDQIALVEAIWDDIVNRGDVPPLTVAQKNGA